MQRVFSGGASRRMRLRVLGLSLHGSAAITLEMGSRFFVECSQNKSDLIGRSLAGVEGYRLKSLPLA